MRQRGWPHWPMGLRTNSHVFMFIFSYFFVPPPSPGLQRRSEQGALLWKVMGAEHVGPVASYALHIYEKLWNVHSCRIHGYSEVACYRWATHRHCACGIHPSNLRYYCCSYAGFTGLLVLYRVSPAICISVSYTTCVSSLGVYSTYIKYGTSTRWLH